MLTTTATEGAGVILVTCKYLSLATLLPHNSYLTITIAITINAMKISLFSKFYYDTIPILLLKCQLSCYWIDGHLDH